VAKKIHVVARALWVFPTLLFLLMVHQAKVAYNLQTTLQNGELAMAEVTDFHQEDRVDVTYDYVRLRVRLGDGRQFEREKLSLPHSLIQRLEGVDQLEVRVLPGASQEVVITSVGATQSRIAAINAAMCLVGFLLLGFAVYRWNTYLARQGDPADRAYGQSSMICF
jgi:hypothetical protein